MKSKTASWHPIYREMARLIGEEATMSLFYEFRGSQINFPMRLCPTTAIKQIVKEEYDGTNLKELARRYDYSERHLRRLLTEN